MNGQDFCFYCRYVGYLVDNVLFYLYILFFVKVLCIYIQEMRNDCYICVKTTK